MKLTNIGAVFLLVLIVSCTSVIGIDTHNWENLNPNEEILTERQKEITRQNANLLAFREMYNKDNEFVDIPQPLIDAYYNALATILTSEAGQQLEVIQELRAFDHRNLNSIIIQPKPDAPFLDNWEDSVIVTDIFDIDRLLADRGFEISRIYDWSFQEELTFVVESEKAVNTIYISELLMKTGYFSLVEMNALCCDGGDIEVEEVINGHEFTFINAYGDCPAGCINRDKYIFVLYENGNVEFKGTN